METNIDIASVDFSVLSAEEIKSMSVVKLTNSNLTGPGSVQDAAFGWVYGTSTPCVTCGEKIKCVGHFGHIELNEPVLHPLFTKTIVMFLRCFCKNSKCNRLILTKEQVGFSGINMKNNCEEFMKKIEKIDGCPHCNTPQPKIVEKSLDKERKIVQVHKHGKNVKLVSPLSVRDIKNIFDNVPDEDIRILGLNPKRSHPRNYVLTAIPVLPLSARPSVTSSDGVTCDDDITELCRQIVGLNEQLLTVNEKDFVVKAEKRLNKKQMLIYQLNYKIDTMYFNRGGKAKHPDGRAIKCITSRLEKKKGGIRNNVMGKRVNQSGRTVIGPGAFLKMNQVGLPEEMCRTMTKPEPVTRFNIEKLKKIVKERKAERIIKANGRKFNLQYATNMQGTKLQTGDIVIRPKNPDARINFEQDINGNVKIPIPIITTRIVNPGPMRMRVGDQLVHYSKKKEKQKLTVYTDEETVNVSKDDIHVRGAKPLAKNGDRYEIPESTSFSILYYTNKNIVLQRGDQVIRAKKLVPTVYPAEKEIELEIGDIVERHVMDGDVVLINRQPTLWKGSMIAMYVVVVPGKIIMFNLCICKSLNADFDGDEMNVHVPQSPEAEAELKILAASDQIIISPQNSKAIVTIVQDSLVGCYLMTHEETKFALSRDQFQQLLCLGNIEWDEKKLETIRAVLKKFKKNVDTSMYNGVPTSEAINRITNKAEREEAMDALRAANEQFNQLYVYNGKGLFSMMLPPYLFYECETEVSKSEPIVRIYNGVLIEGALTKAVVGNSGKSLIQVIHSEYGVETVCRFIDNVQFIASGWLLVHGYSIGIGDCVISEQTRKNINSIIVTCFTKANIMKESISHPEIREIKIIGELSKARDIGMRMASHEMREGNGILTAIRAGAKGDSFNVAQICGVVGQQTYESGRMAFTLNNGTRSLIYFPKKITDEFEEYLSRGYVTNSFGDGMTAIQLFLHAVAARVGVADSASKTGDTGYLQRRLVKTLEDVKIAYDGTVRGNDELILGFGYPGGVDPMHTVPVQGVQQFCNAIQIVNKFNFMHEEELKEKEQEQGFKEQRLKEQGLKEQVVAKKKSKEHKDVVTIVAKMKKVKICK